MNYPVWDVPGIGSGLVVAIIAIIHVFISHLAIGGGAFIWIAEVWSDRIPQGAQVRGFLHKYATFFLVFTTVFGAMTGVGIWFAIQLANPEATSLLIHQFVFAWATEWVAFLGELTVLYLYYYGFGRTSRKMQVFLAGAYFVIAWISLFIINGILSFMLTPGQWTVQNTSVFAGFFNPGFWPSLLIRTAMMLLIAGVSAMMVASRLSDLDLKERVVRFAARFVVPAAALVPALVLWYYSTLPETTVKLVEGGVTGLAGGKMEIITRHLWLAGTAGGLVVLGTLVAAAAPRAITTASAIALMLVVQIGIMGGEFFREMARKPYVVSGVLYSNSLWKKDATEEALKKPFFQRTVWEPAAMKAGEPGHGEWVYRLQCANCHTRGGYRQLAERTASWTPTFGYRFFDAMDAQGVMPPFQGDRHDRAALTAYLLSLHGKKVQPAQVLAAVEREEAEKKQKELQKKQKELQQKQDEQPKAQPGDAPAAPEPAAPAKEARLQGADAPTEPATPEVARLQDPQGGAR